MNTVLVVDDDRQALDLLREGLSKYLDNVTVLTAENGQTAVQLLESTPVDIVVSDIKMPVMDGFELLAYMNKHFAFVPVIVLSAYFTAETKKKLERFGSLICMGKPVKLRQLADAVGEMLACDLKGEYLKGISLAGFLQLVEMEQKTCLLEVLQEKGGKKGFFCFHQGQLYDAICGSLTAEEAAYEMLGWESVTISFKTIAQKKIRRRVSTGLMNLILEGLRRKDEKCEHDKPAINISDHRRNQNTTSNL